MVFPFAYIYHHDHLDKDHYVNIHHNPKINFYIQKHKDKNCESTSDPKRSLLRLFWYCQMFQNKVYDVSDYCNRIDYSLLKEP